MTMGERGNERRGFPSRSILVRKQREAGADALMISSFSSFHSKIPAKGTKPLAFKVSFPFLT